MRNSISTRTRRGSSRSVLPEMLETRRLMSVTLGTNAIVNANGDVDTGVSDSGSVVVPTGWTANGAGTATVVKYGTSGFPTSGSPGPSSRGANLFAGGPNNDESDLFQNLDASNLGSQIDANQIKYTLNGFLGGFSNQNDNASVFLNFSDSGHGFIDQVFIGPVSAADRGNVTELLFRTKSGNLPAGTRFIQVQIHFDGGDGSYNDGYADALSLTLASNVSTVGSVAGTVFNDLNLNITQDPGDNGKGGVKVFLDKDNDGVIDSNEQSTTTAADGTYKISNVPAGSYQLRQFAVSGFRTVSPNPISLSVSGGSNITGKNFAISDTAKVSGSVFNDTNGNKTRDPGESLLSGVTVYLDFNNNGQLDSFEISKKTDSNGNYAFAVPFGTYVLRIIVPANEVQTTASSITVTMAKGQTVTGKLFGIHPIV